MSRNPHEQDVFKQSNNEPDHRTDNGDKPIQGADAKALEQPEKHAVDPNQNRAFAAEGWGWANASVKDSVNHGPQQHENVIQDQSGTDTSHNEFGQHSFWENSSGWTTDGWSSWPWMNHHDLFV